MNREEVHELIKVWSHETCMLSYHNYKHPAYLTLLTGGEEIIPFLLERLENSIGRDSGDTYDHDNSPWVTIMAIGDISLHDSHRDFPREYAGNLDKLRECILTWGKANYPPL